MPYFSEVNDYKTYAGQADDFHFSYNVNSGGGQSFLGGKFRNENGEIESASVLNGRVGIFQFRITGVDGVLHSVSLEDGETQYEIKPRAAGDSNMKLGVEDKKTPSVAISAFLMLPKPCGVKRADHADISPLCSKNYWLQSMWMSVDKTSQQIATLIPKDCVFSGGVDRNGNGQLRHFKVDFAKRISDVIAVAKKSKLDKQIADCVAWFADVYEGRKSFVCDDAVAAIDAVMGYLQIKYPDRYSGLMDPLPLIKELAGASINTYTGGMLLSTALRLFRKYRLTWTNKFSKGEPVYKNINTDVRAFFGDPKNWNSAGLKTDANSFKDFCIHHTWMLQNGKGWTSLSQYTDADRAAFVDWADEHIVKNVKPLVETVCTDNGFKGVTNKAVTELLMKFHPDQYCLCNTPTLEALRTLGLLAIDVPDQYGFHEYQHVMGLCAQLRQLLEDAEIFRIDGGKDAPDYLTVNEFLYFVHDNKDLIDKELKEAKRMNDEKLMKEIDDSLTTRTSNGLTFTAGNGNDLLMLRLMAALRAKPFVILAGHSGTGKSRLVRKLAYMTCNVDKLWDEKRGPRNFKMIQVKPNWHDSSDLLGYRSAIKDNKYVGSELVKFIFRAYTYPKTPFFLCLDEMNLAPVEQYFAEFLSAMESIRPAKQDDTEGTGDFVSDPVIDLNVSDDAPNKDANLFELGCESKRAYQWVKDHGFTIPKNLFVVGTVNMDESTNQFSRKVLDRAMTIEMTEASFADYGKVGEPRKEDFIGNDLIAKLVNRPVRVAQLVKDGEDIKTVHPGLVEVQECLKKTPFAVAFRFANEYALYKLALKVFDANDAMKCNPLDHAVLMKVLPRIVGEAEDVAEIYCGTRDPKDAKNAKEGSLLGILKEESMLSNAKMKEILGRKSTYLTFWP